MLGYANSSLVRVIFTEQESADDKIKSIVEQSPLKKSIVVVTDDRDIKYAVRPLGATVMGVKEFWAKMKSSAAKQESSHKASKAMEKEEEKLISKTLEYKITSEFEKIWLEKDGPKKHR